jgi:hypothetical protein
MPPCLLATPYPAVPSRDATQRVLPSQDGINDVVDVMIEYGLDRDDYDAVNSFLDLLAPKTTGARLLSSVCVSPCVPLSLCLSVSLSFSFFPSLPRSLSPSLSLSIPFVQSTV